MNFRPGPLADVSYESDGDRWTLVFVRDLRHPPETVWAALTDPQRVGEWAPYTADRDLGTTGDMTLTLIDGDTAQELACTVLRAEPPTLLEHTFGPDLLRWELASTATGTRVTLRHTVQDKDFGPKAAAGWHLCLDVAQRLLDGDPVGPIRGRQALDFGFEALDTAYARRLR